MTRIVIDTGPIVALLNRRDRYHTWAREMLDTVASPIFTCEAVISEACFLLSRFAGGQDKVMEMLTQEIVQIGFQLQSETDAVRSLMSKYSSVPMSLADACLVRMTELDSASAIVTVDADFKVYRRNRRQVIPTIMPTRGSST